VASTRIHGTTSCPLVREHPADQRPHATATEIQRCPPTRVALEIRPVAELVDQLA
jgi:hypothetical protein